MVRKNKKIAWYNRLKNDCRKILKDHNRSDLIYRWSLGERILRDFDKFGKPRYGSKEMSYLAMDVGVPESLLYKFVQFARKYPTMEKLEKEILSHGIKWTKIRDDLIVENRRINEYKIFPFNGWNIARPDTRFGNPNYPGKLAPEILFDVISMLTGKGDLVVDPCVGGGTTIDVCRQMNRRCIGYDIQPNKEDIIQNDVTTGIPLEDNSVNLIIFDPPYHDMLKGKYSDLPTDLSNVSLEDFYKYLDEKITREIFRVLKPGGHVFFIIEQKIYTGTSEDLSLKSYDIFLKNGFEYVVRGAALYSKYLKRKYIARAKREKVFLNIVRDVFILKKPENFI
jgi:DNA modification methylase